MVCSGKVLSAQTPAERPFVWGGLISYDVQLLGIQSPVTNEPEQIRVESGRAAHGGSVGVFGKWHLWNGLWVQQAVTLSTLRSRVFDQPVAGKNAPARIFSAGRPGGLEFCRTEHPLPSPAARTPGGGCGHGC